MSSRHGLDAFPSGEEAGEHGVELAAPPAVRGDAADPGGEVLLPDSEKVYDRRVAMETLKAIIPLGYRIEPPGEATR